MKMEMSKSPLMNGRRLDLAKRTKDLYGELSGDRENTAQACWLVLLAVW